MADQTLINLGELSKPATVLIEKISDAVGGICRPWQIVRVAKAEAEAERIRADMEILVTDLSYRAAKRFIEEEVKKQCNMEEITDQAIRLLTDESKPQDIADDWIANFFDKCRIVSDKDMQRLWGSILAREANTPGAFSRKTVNLMADLDKSDAKLFATLCRFSFSHPTTSPLVFDVKHEVYNRHGINFTTLSHLQSLGLVNFDGVRTFSIALNSKACLLAYFSKGLILTMPKDENNKFDIGHVLLTQAGEELARVCDCEPVDGLLEYVCERWRAKSYNPQIAGQLVGGS